MARQKKSCSPLLSTYESVLDTVVEIAPAGCAEVFDIQVAETENFIANGLVSHNTRWHEDDLAGRLLNEQAQGGEPWRVINFPAVAEDHDILGRAPGDPLWPARYNTEALARIERTIGPQKWASLYQQRPAPLEGGLFKREWFEIMPQGAPKDGWERLVRAWDFGYTDADGDWTVGVLMGLRNGILWILDVVRGQWVGGKRNDCMSLIAGADDAAYDGKVTIHFPQDPAAGKEVAERIARLLAGYRVSYETVSRDKEARSGPFRDFAWAEWRAGRRVKIVQAAWVKKYLDELCVFPNGAHDDQVDASSLGFMKVSKAVRQFAIGAG